MYPYPYPLYPGYKYPRVYLYPCNALRLIYTSWPAETKSLPRSRSLIRSGSARLGNESDVSVSTTPGNTFRKLSPPTFRVTAFVASSAYAHQQNGRAERVMRTIQGRMRAMMVTVDAPFNLWGEAALACTYLFLRTPSVSLPACITPYEAFYGRPPDMSNLRVWGCRCFARVSSELQTKLGVRSRDCIFVGYPDGAKGYRV